MEVTGLDAVGNIAAVKVAEAMRVVQTRFAEIENITGISFSAQLRRAQLHSDSQTPFNDLVERSANTRETEPRRAERPEDPAAYSNVSDHGEPLGTGGFSRLAPSAYDHLFLEAAERYALNPALIKAVAFAESTFRPDVTSSSGAMGIMQLMPFTAEALGVDDPYDPWQSVDGGARVLSQHLNRFGGNTLMALAAYNAGAYGVTSRGVTDLSSPAQRDLLPRETQGYIARIEAYLEAAQALYVLENQTVFG
jgi:soluble lytic murein transglycosylase-like protein